MKMPRLWAFCLLLASANSLPISQLDRSCRLAACGADINLGHIAQLEKHMMPERDACDDFHKYACGNWGKEHETGVSGVSAVSAVSLSGASINKQYVELFQRLLKQPRAPEHQLPMYAKLLGYYESCLMLGKPQLRRYLQLLPTSLEWQDQLAVLGRYGYAEHYVKIALSPYNATRHIVLVQPHNYNLSLNLSRSIYDALFGPLPELEQLRTDFKTLEAKLQALSKPTNSSNDDSVHNLTLEQLQQKLPQLNWTHVLELQLGHTYPGRHQLLVDDLPALEKLLKYLNQADKRLLQLYSWARFLQHLQQLPHDPLSSDGSSGSSGSAEVNCVEHMRKALYLPMNYVYEHSFYSRQRAQDERVIFGVFEELKAQLALKLKRNKFGLNATLLAALLDKVHGIRLNIGNMPRNVSDQFYVNCEQHWRVGADFYDNHLQSLLHYYVHQAELERSENETMRQIWYSFNHHGPELQDNIDATPYFYCVGSIIIIPYAYVQMPFYHAQFWPALLYGDLANTLGHEMLHPFDTYFVDYDTHGVMRDYSDQLLLNENYKAAVDCLNDTAVVMLNERAADISGTRLALQTYLKDPTDKLRNGRVFFLQFAQFFCGEEADSLHDTGSRRLNYALAQMPEFAEVYECAKNTPMNPAERCPYW